MIKSSEWHTAHPEAYKIAKESSEQGYPTGIAYDKELGWCVLMSGQGPFIAWAENDPDNLDVEDKEE